jgi:hypothetical protein
MEDLIQNYGLICQQMFRFLYLDDRVQVSRSISNPASMPRSRHLQQVLWRPSAFKELIKRIIPQKLRYRAKKALLDANAGKFTYPPMKADTCVLLKNQFKDDNRHFGEMINRDLSIWEQK